MTTSEFKPTHRHYKGGLYEVIGEAMNSSNDGSSEIVTVYRNENGDMFARYMSEFRETLPDGRKRFDLLKIKP